LVGDAEVHSRCFKVVHAAAEVVFVFLERCRPVLVSLLYKPLYLTERNCDFILYLLCEIDDEIVMEGGAKHSPSAVLGESDGDFGFHVLFAEAFEKDGAVSLGLVSSQFRFDVDRAEYLVFAVDLVSIEVLELENVD